MQVRRPSGILSFDSAVDDYGDALEVPPPPANPDGSAAAGVEPCVVASPSSCSQCIQIM